MAKINESKAVAALDQAHAVQFAKYHPHLMSWGPEVMSVTQPLYSLMSPAWSLFALEYAILLALRSGIFWLLDFTH